MSSEAVVLDTEENNDKHLLFKLGAESYAVPLLDVVEVVEPQPAKPLPNMVDHFLGVVNLRGQVIGILDLRKKFNIDIKDGGAHNAIIIFNADESLLGILVDKVTDVLEIRDGDIEGRPNVSTRIPMEYLTGIGKSNDDLVTILQLSKLLSDEELMSYRNSIL